MFILSAKDKPSISGGNIAYVLIVCFGMYALESDCLGSYSGLPLLATLSQTSFLNFYEPIFSSVRYGNEAFYIRVMGFK